MNRYEVVLDGQGALWGCDDGAESLAEFETLEEAQDALTEALGGRPGAAGRIYDHRTFDCYSRVVIGPAASCD